MSKRLTMQNAFAAYHESFDWVPLSSIRVSPEDVERWINKTYVSGSARSQFTIVKVRIDARENA
jgi:hypothetical protein